MVLSQSKAEFSISNFGFNTVTGTFKGFSGTVEFDPQALADAKIDVCLSVETVRSGIAKRDEHLQKAEWFQAAAYPQICFVSEEVVAMGNGAFRAKGQLHLKGKTTQVSIPLSYSPGQLRGELNLNRLDYDLGTDTNTFTVGADVHVKITCFFKT